MKYKCNYCGNTEDFLRSIFQTWDDKNQTWINESDTTSHPQCSDCQSPVELIEEHNEVEILVRFEDRVNQIKSWDALMNQCKYIFDKYNETEDETLVDLMGDLKISMVYDPLPDAVADWIKVQDYLEQHELEEVSA